MSTVENIKSVSIDLKPGLNYAFGDAARTKYANLVQWKAVRKFQDMMDATYKITSDEVTAIQKEIEHILRWGLKTSGLVTFKNIGKGMLKWEYNRWTDVPAPRWTRDFGLGKQINIAKEALSIELMGMDYDYHLTMPEIDLYSNSNRKVAFTESLKEGLFTELNRSLMQYREFFLGFGTSIPNMSSIAGYTGLFNDAGITDPGALGGGSDDNMTASEDISDGAALMATKLITLKFEPPFTLQMTPGILSQAIRNKTAAPQPITDMQLIKDLELPDGTKLFNKFVMNPFMISSLAEVNATGAIAVTKEGPENYRIMESYPFGFYPLPPVDLGITGKILWMGGVEMKHPEAMVYADALTTDSFAA